jgi:outer membrane receptor for ferrienterochelin and colicin
MKNLKIVSLFIFIQMLNFGFNISNISAQKENCELVGKVIEKKTGNSIIGAIITIPGTSFGAVSDVMGEYRISLPNGIYSVDCRMISYSPIQINDVNTKGQKKIQLDFILEESTQEGNTLEIFEFRKTNTEAAVLMEMKDAKGVVSGMSSTQIAKGQDRDASQVARRIPGVTIVDNRFVMVRGLSSRYNATMINGILAPSLESDARAFSFDIIPSAAIDRFLIYKSPSADLPGEFAGGAINVITKNFPDDKTSIDFAYTQGFRNGTTSKPFVTNGEYGSDLLGMGNRDRLLPDAFPDNLRTINNADEQLKWTRSLPNNWSLQNHIAPLDQRFNFTIGKKWSLKKMVIGNYTSINYSRTQMLQKTERSDYNEFDHVNQISDTVFHYSDNIYNQNSQLGILNNWGFRWKTGTAEFKNLLNQNGQQVNTLRNGINIEEGTYRKEYSMRYTQRLVYTAQAGITQNLFQNKGIASATLGFGTTQRKDPDWKRIRYTLPTDGSETAYSAYIPFSAQPFYLGRLFMNLNEYIQTAQASYEHKLWKTSKEDEKDEKWITLKTGTYVEVKNRTFTSRNLGYRMANVLNFDYSISHQSMDNILNTENLNSTDGLILDEDTRGADAYEAHNRLMAYYLMANIPYHQWNLSMGLRREHNRQWLNSADITGKPIEAELDSAMWLPSFNLSYQLNKKSLLRLAYGKTVNRPEFRELAPFSFYDFENNFINSGNPQLQFATIRNMDLRWEHYPNNTEIISAALFYKEFKNPIEQYFVPGVGSGGTRSFMPGNALSATSYGAEIDIRKSLENIGSNQFIDHLVVVANASYIISDISLSKAGIETGLNPNRPMVGQSPYIINGGLYYDNDTTGWQFSALYNVIGPRISIVGIPGVPEVYEMPRHVIDLSVSKQMGNGLSVRFGIQDALNQSFYLIQDANQDGSLNKQNDQVMQKYNRGTYFTFGIQYKFRER